MTGQDEQDGRVPANGLPRLPFEWRRQTGRFVWGEDLLVRGLKVGLVVYDGVSNRTVSGRYTLETNLPGLRPRRDRFATPEEAKAALERFTSAWLSRLLGDGGPV